MPNRDNRSDARVGPAPHLPLIIVLRVLGATDMLAFIAVAMPAAWIRLGHQWSGLGDFPEAPIASYLARSASALYALHGMMIIYMSFDVSRYWFLIRFLARLAIAHGFVMLAIDVGVGMPVWWSTLEGPAFSATGLIVLLVQGWAGSESLPRPTGVDGCRRPNDQRHLISSGSDSQTAGRGD